MKRLPCLSFGLLLSSLLVAHSPAADTPATAVAYGQAIVVPEKPNDRLQAAIDDLQRALKKMTGQEFALKKEGAGIVLARSGSPSAPADAAAKLKGKGREPFLIRSADDKSLLIVANGDDGLSHGIYFYLEQLGCRWLLPGDNWEIIPQRKDIAVKVDRLVEPAFKLRAFFGTGGYGPESVYDPKYDKQGRLKFRIRQEDWQRRNRFGGEIALGGHAGESFNLGHKEILNQHPEYLAETGGKRQWSETTKLCASNADAVKLWVEDRLKDYRAARKSSPDTPYSFAVSVDPADGAGFCECAECRKRFAAPTDQILFSNQVFFMANEVAKAVRAEFPDGWVNLYAYAHHSAPPTFALEPNVYVSVIPYGFNYSGLQPDDLIRAWGKKAARLSIYDYWSIPDWAWDQPTFNYLEAARDKIRFWHANRIEGFSSESTYGAGAMGVAWYLSSRLMWDPNADQDSILKDFYEKAFGPAAPPMKRMLERWARGFLLCSHELGTSYRDLQEAGKLAGADAATQGRIDDYARYVHYLRLYCERNSGLKPEALVGIDKKLVEHLFDIYDTGMVHSFRLYQFLVDYGRNTEVYNEFDQQKKEAPGWERVAPLSHADVAALIEDGAAKHRPLDFEMRTYSGKLVPHQPLKALEPVSEEEKWGTKMPTRGGLDVELEAQADLKRLPLRVCKYYTNTIKVMDARGQTIFTREIKGTKEYEKADEFEVPLPSAGRYRIEFCPEAGGGFWFQTRPGVTLAFSSFMSEMGAPSPRIYFYVPRGTKKIAMWFPTGDWDKAYTQQVFNPDEEKVPVERHDGGRLILVKVEPGEDGRAWSLKDVRTPNAPHRMLNVPQAFSFSPETLMVPEDALK
jgi:hypothetical protein